MDEAKGGYEGIPTSIEGVSFDEIYNLFANSSYGESLKQAIRYGPLKPANLSNEEWVKILGPDINNLEHLKVVLSLTQDFIYHTLHPHKEWRASGEEIKFNREEQELLCLIAVTHDWGEAIVGDIVFPQKTSSDAERELGVLKGIIQELCANKYSESLVEKMHLAADVAFHKDRKKLGQAFHAVERIGYGNNVLRAWQERSGYNEDLFWSLSWFAKEVLSSHLPTLKEHAKIYPATHYFILQNEETLKEIQDADIDWRDVPILANN